MKMCRVSSGLSQEFRRSVAEILRLEIELSSCLLSVTFSMTVLFWISCLKEE